MKGPELILDFGDHPVPNPKNEQSEHRAKKPNKAQEVNTLHNTKPDNTAAGSNQPAENTSSKKVKKETKVSTPKMDKTEKKSRFLHNPYIFQIIGK